LLIRCIRDPNNSIGGKVSLVEFASHNWNCESNTSARNA
jgi:hypothetical protein